MLTRLIAGALTLAAPVIAAAVVDKLVERLPEIADVLADRLPDFSNLDDQIQEALANLPNIGEQVVQEIKKSLPFGLGRQL